MKIVWVSQRKRLEPTKEKQKNRPLVRVRVVQLSAEGPSRPVVKVRIVY